MAILELWSESGSWAYQSFETAVSRLYWAFLVPLAALFDWGRRMFETRQEIRKAAVEKAIKKAIKKEFAKLSRRLRESLEPYKDKLDVDDVVRRTFHVDR